MKKQVISMMTACLLSAAAMASSFAEDGVAAAARAAGPSDVRGSLYTHISKDVKAEAPSLQARPVQLTPEQGREYRKAPPRRLVFIER